MLVVFAWVSIYHSSKPLAWLLIEYAPLASNFSQTCLILTFVLARHTLQKIREGGGRGEGVHRGYDPPTNDTHKIYAARKINLITSCLAAIVSYRSATMKRGETFQGDISSALRQAVHPRGTNAVPNPRLISDIIQRCLGKPQKREKKEEKRQC